MNILPLPSGGPVDPVVRAADISLRRAPWREGGVLPGEVEESRHRIVNPEEAGSSPAVGINAR